jgi:hypothetical protein
VYSGLAKRSSTTGAVLVLVAADCRVVIGWFLGNHEKIESRR